MAKRTYARVATAMIGAACLALAACASGQPQAPAQAEELGVAAAGRAYAESVCAACHAIGAGETQSPRFSAPPFQAIAEAPGMTSLAFSVWMRSSHPTMPDLLVEPARADDLWAYISTLKRAPTPP